MITLAIQGPISPPNFHSECQAISNFAAIQFLPIRSIQMFTSKGTSYYSKFPSDQFTCDFVVRKRHFRAMKSPEIAHLPSGSEKPWIFSLLSSSLFSSLSSSSSSSSLFKCQNHMLHHWIDWRIYTLINLTLIGSDNGLSPVQRHAIMRNNVESLAVGPLGENLNHIFFEIQNFHLRKTFYSKLKIFIQEKQFKMSSAKWRLQAYLYEYPHDFK